jgi:hypothetical protein
MSPLAWQTVAFLLACALFALLYAWQDRRDRNRGHR